MNPEKLQLQSADGAQINLDMLYQIAPSCFTEARGADGREFTIKKDVNLLRDHNAYGTTVSE